MGGMGGIQRKEESQELQNKKAPVPNEPVNFEMSELVQNREINRQF